MDIDLEFDDADCELEADDALATDSKNVILALDRSMRRVDVDGHLHVANCNISRAMVCPYLGSEIPDSDILGLDPSKIYYLYRDPAELAAAAPTYENKPLMVAHIAVSADQPQKFYVGGTVSNVRFVTPFLRADIAVWDGEAIRGIENGTKREISAGYRYVADMTPGVVDGVKFDGVMRRLACNHVALVETGRCGPDVMVADARLTRGS